MRDKKSEGFTFSIQHTPQITELFFNGQYIGSVRNWKFHTDPAKVNSPGRRKKTVTFRDISRHSRFTLLRELKDFLKEIIDTVELREPDLRQVPCAGCGKPAGWAPKEKLKELKGHALCRECLESGDHK